MRARKRTLTNIVLRIAAALDEIGHGTHMM